MPHIPTHERANPHSVTRFLIGNFEIPEDQAIALVKKHNELVAKGYERGSQATYVADAIGDAEGLTYIGKLDEKIDNGPDGEDEDE